MFALINKYGYIIPWGVPAAETGAIPLEELYVPLKLRIGGMKPAQYQDRDSISMPVDERHSLQAILNRKESPGLTIIGGPGSGKTTAISHIALELGRYRLANKGLRRFGLGFSRPNISEEWGDLRGKLPIVIELKKLNNPGEQLSGRSLLTMSMGSPLTDRCSEDMFEEFFGRGECVVLFDGLDEVSSKRRRAVVENIKDFVAADGRKGNIFLLTCREAVFSGIGGFSVYSLCEFVRTDVEQYTRHWYRAMLSLRNPDKVDLSPRQRSEIETNAQSLINAVWDHKFAGRLVVNPLLLSMLAVIYRPAKKLPEGRVEFYDDCLPELLGKMDQAKGVENRFTARQKLAVLEPLAYWMHHQQDSEADETELLKRISQKLPEIGEEGSLENAAAFLAETKERTGVLVDMGSGKYGFPHRTFREYLTAREFRNREVEGRRKLLQRVGEPGWEEVCLFYVGLGTNPNAIVFVDEIHCRRRDPLMTNLFLAARCLEEMVVVEKPTVEAKVIQSLVKEIEEDQFEGLKEKARRVLMHMGNSQRSMPVIKAIKKMLYRPPLRQEAAFMLIKLREIDEDVVKAILEMLRSTKQEERLKARYALNEIAHSAQSCDSVLQFLSSPEAKYRGTAALALGWLGINDGVMISKIIALLEDDNQSVRRRCAAALGWIGHASDDVIMALVRRLTLQEKTSVRRIAATALGELGDPREEVVNALLTLIREQEGDVCGTAASSLGWLGDDRPEVRDALLGLLDSPVEDVRGRAVLALGDLGVSEEAVTNRVAQLLNNEKSKEVQWRAASALAQVGQSSEIVVTALAARVRMGKVRVLSGATDKAEIRQKELVVKHASQALTWLNHGSGVVINILKELAERGTGNQRADAVAAIGRLGLVDQAILELMMRRIDEEKEKEEDVRGAAISALRRLRVADKGILVAITDSLETDSATSVKWRAAQALGVLGQPDQKTIGILKSKLNARETEIKLRAAEALINLGKGGKPAADALVSLLSNRNPSIAQHAVKVLRLLGQRSKSINDELLRVFQNATDTELKGEITTTFGALKCTKPEVITELVGTLSDADMELRAKSASTLSELARNEKEVIKSIAGLLATEDSALRRKAVMGLYLLLRGSQTGIQEMPSTDELELVDLLDSLMKDEAEIGHPLVGAQSRVKDVAWWVLQEYQRSYPIQYKQRYPAT